MERQIEHMVRLVDDLMEVSRIARGKIDLRLGAVSLDRVIQDAVDLSRPLLEVGAHRLDVDTAAAANLSVEGDRIRLAQVFANLMNNAAKCTPSGGRIELLAERVDGQALVTVRDNGNGIGPEMLTRAHRKRRL